MTDLSLYEQCLQKTAMCLRDGMYDSYLENPFSSIPTTIANDLLPECLNLGSETGWTANNLRLLLTSRNLSEVKINGYYLRMNVGFEINNLLHILTSSSQKLQVLHLRLASNRVSMRSEIEVTLGELLNNCPNLKVLSSDLKFDLARLRNCRNLRVLKVLFRPGRGEWSDFLVNDGRNFQQHDCLEYFFVDYGTVEGTIPRHSKDIANILRNCPKLYSLGYLESSGALSLLQDENVSPSEIKIRHCYWSDRQYPTKETDRMEKLIKAIRYYPVVEELDIVSEHIQTISNLRYLTNLTYLNITARLKDNINEVLGDVCKKIGSQLKHFSFETYSDVDISSFLQYCPNLRSLKSDSNKDRLSASSPLNFPHLQRLIFHLNSSKDVSQTLPQISGCNELTELFVSSLDDETLKRFMKNNSLANLKIARLTDCSLSESYIREFLLNSPKLEKVEIDYNFRANDTSYFKTILSEINHKIIFSNLRDKEFFQQRYDRIMIH